MAACAIRHGCIRGARFCTPVEDSLSTPHALKRPTPPPDSMTVVTADPRRGLARQPRAKRGFAPVSCARQPIAPIVRQRPFDIAFELAAQNLLHGVAVQRATRTDPVTLQERDDLRHHDRIMPSVPARGHRNCGRRCAKSAARNRHGGPSPKGGAMIRRTPAAVPRPSPPALPAAAGLLSVEREETPSSTPKEFRTKKSR